MLSFRHTWVFRKHKLLVIALLCYAGKAQPIRKTLTTSLQSCAAAISNGTEMTVYFMADDEGGISDEDFHGAVQEHKISTLQGNNQHPARAQN
jgi:hypothetical protein